MKKTILLIILFFCCLSIFQLNAQSVVEDNKQEIPEELSYALDVLLDKWVKDKITTSNCYNSDDAPIYLSDDQYIQKLYNFPSSMELTYNNEVKKYIEMYIGRRREQVSRMLALGKLYFPIFEEELDKEDLPLELKYLPVIESALNPIAKSRAGATGLWQFMAGTGKAYKLEINSLVDERRDPVKATKAAVKYLKDMYKIYGDWNLVIAAYNCGPGNVNKAIARSGGERDYWKIYPFLPKETRGYVPAFIGATYAMTFYEDHNICPADNTMPVLIDTIGVEKMLHLRQVADVMNIDIEDIRHLNPQYKTDVVPGGNKRYVLNLPVGLLTNFLANENSIYQYRAKELFSHRKVQDPTASKAKMNNSTTTHKVKQGETIFSLAKKYGLTVSQLKKMNNLSNDNIAIGRNLKVTTNNSPNSSSLNYASNENKKIEFFRDGEVLKKRIKSQVEDVKYVTVNKGDTWGHFSKRAGASIANIKKWNNINGNVLSAGKKMKIFTSNVSEQIEDIIKPAPLELDKQSLIDIINLYIEENALPSSKEGFSKFLGKPEYDNYSNNWLLNLEEENSDIKTTMSEAKVFDNEFHEIAFGETINQIAKKYNLTIPELLKLNGVKDEKEFNLKVSRLRVKNI